MKAGRDEYKKVTDGRQKLSFVFSPAYWKFCKAMFEKYS